MSVSRAVSSRRLIIFAASCAVALGLLSCGAPGQDESPRSSTSEGPSPEQATTSSPAPDSAGSARPSPSDEGEPTGVGADSLEAAEAQATIAEAMAQISADLQSTEEEKDLSEVASGAFLDSAEAMQEQYRREGIRSTGEVIVEDVTVLESLDNGQLLVQACLDSSAMELLDENGEDLRGAGTFDRSQMIFTLEPQQRGWVVAEETFAEDPEC